MSTPVLVGNGAGFSGDRVDAPIPVVRSLVARGRFGVRLATAADAEHKAGHEADAPY